jgi:transcriptional regulator with XRE-family HTH domain
MADLDRPEWAQRLRRERLARRWSQADAVRAMRTFSAAPLPDDLLGMWKRWERGRNKPDEFYRPLIAAVFGTVAEALFGERRLSLTVPDQESRDRLLVTATGMDTLEILNRIRSSSLNGNTLEALDMTVEQLCCDYVGANTQELITTSRDWLSRMTGLLDQRLTLKQHREILTQAGQLALLLGCLEYDAGDKNNAEATRRMALEIGKEAENSHIIGWAYEMRAWFALTIGNYRGVINAAQAGQDAASSQSVAVQLAAQEAKAWARMGNQRNVMQALEKGRKLLESLPYPDRPENHFVVDPSKFDFYAMDCYRIAGQNSLAEVNAQEVIRQTTDPDGTVTSPMRNTEARITLGVVAARNGDAEEAVAQGMAALQNTRRSRPSLRMVGSELDHALQTTAAGSAPAREFHTLFTEVTKAS